MSVVIILRIGVERAQVIAARQLFSHRGKMGTEDYYGVNVQMQGFWPVLLLGGNATETSSAVITKCGPTSNIFCLSCRLFYIFVLEFTENP